MNLNKVIPYACSRTNNGISHLLYADDSLLFLNGNLNSIKSAMDLLSWYEVLSGQKVNKDKSSIFFPKKIKPSRKKKILSITNMKMGSFPTTYLGAPLFQGRIKISYFNALVEKIRNRIEGWKAKLLSPAGKIVLINSILTSIPIHIFSVLSVPLSIIHSIEKYLKTFLWTSGDSKHHWVAWQQVLCSKQAGGLGIHSLQQTIVSLHCKLTWKFIKGDGLWANFMRAKFQQWWPFIYHGITKTGRMIVKFFDIVNSHVEWKIGKGYFPFWESNWANCDLASIANPPHKHALVYDVFQSPNILQEILTHLPDDWSNLVLQARRCWSMDLDDLLCWKLDPSRQFSAHSIKKLLFPQQPQLDLAKVWLKHIPPRVAFFTWRLRKNRIPTDEGVLKIGIQLVSKCLCCDSPSQESNFHLFCDSLQAREVWNPYRLAFNIPHFTSMEHMFSTCLDVQASNQVNLLIQSLPGVICWSIWKHRNKVKHNGIKWSTSYLHKVIRNMLADCTTLMVPKQEPSFLSLVSLQALKIPIAQVPLKKGRWIRWIPPLRGIKLNFDGAYAAGISSMGGVFRDTHGALIYAYSTRVEDGNTNWAELQALLMGLQLAYTLSIEIAEVEGDSQWVINGINKGRHSYLSQVEYMDITNLLQGAKVFHCCREANKAADYMASLGYHTTHFEVWNAPDSPALKKILLEDALGFSTFRT